MTEPRRLTAEALHLVLTGIHWQSPRGTYESLRDHCAALEAELAEARKTHMEGVHAAYDVGRMAIEAHRLQIAYLESDLDTARAEAERLRSTCEKILKRPICNCLHGCGCETIPHDVLKIVAEALAGEKTK